jgi:hypothetical protein
MDKTRKITTIILWVLMILSIAFFVYMIVSIDDEKSPGAAAVQAITMNLNWAIILVAFAGAIALFFAFIQIIGDKRKAIGSVVSLVILGVVLLVSYSLASPEIPVFHGAEKMITEGTLNESISRWVGTGLNVTYILFAGALLSIAGFGAASVFKRS